MRSGTPAHTHTCRPRLIQSPKERKKKSRTKGEKWKIKQALLLSRKKERSITIPGHPVEVLHRHRYTNRGKTRNMSVPSHLEKKQDWSNHYFSLIENLKNQKNSSSCLARCCSWIFTQRLSHHPPPSILQHTAAGTHLNAQKKSVATAPTLLLV